MLQSNLDGSELYLSRVVMRDLALSQKDAQLLREQQQWLEEHRGQAMAEVVLAQLLQPLYVTEAWSGAEADPAQAIAGLVR